MVNKKITTKPLNIPKTRVFNGKTYYLMTGAGMLDGVTTLKKDVAKALAEDVRRQGALARVVKITYPEGRKYAVYTRG